MTRERGWWTERYIKSPIRKQPTTLTASVPNANRSPKSRMHVTFVRYRATAPMAPKAAISASFCIAVITPQPLSRLPGKVVPNPAEN
jgi:hypothetical protein